MITGLIIDIDSSRVRPLSKCAATAFVDIPMDSQKEFRGSLAPATKINLVFLLSLMFLVLVVHSQFPGS